MFRVVRIIQQSVVPSSAIASCMKNISTNTSPLLLKFTPCLFAEPLKKKKKLDPAIIKQREDRRKKRLEKQIKKLEKNRRQLKPIDELEIPLCLIEQKEQRSRSVPPLSESEKDARILLEKEWSGYRYKQHLAEVKMIDRIISSQEKALEELRKESEELYIEAIQIDPTLVPFSARGPVRTPPIKDYDSPDGEYIDRSKKWE